MGSPAPITLPMDDARGDSDVYMSDRMVPSRDTCGQVSQMMLDRDENWAPRNNYHDILSHNVLGKESLANVKVLSYKHKPAQQKSGHNELRVLYSSNRDAAEKPKIRPNRVVPQSALKVLDAPGVSDDFYSHPIDWSSRNVVAVALSETVFLFDAASGRTEKLFSLPSSGGAVTSLRWTGEGLHLGVGTSNGDVQIWDSAAQRQLRNLRGHGGRIGALAWNDHILSSGSVDAEIHHHDVRVRDHLIGRLVGAHEDLVCGLDYSESGVLASGGNDNAVCIWESIASREPLCRLTEHRAAVKALKWCPWQRNVLATGGGSADRQICLWNASSGRLLMSADAESQVTAIAWAPQERELVTAHGYSRNHLSIWKYPSLVKSADLEGHGGRILDMAQSPDGSLICSASADETLRFWQMFAPRASEKKSSCERGSAPNPILRTIR